MTGRAIFLALLIMPAAHGIAGAAEPARFAELSVVNVDALGAATQSAPIAKPASPQPIVTGLQPAPLPDPDADGPHESAGIGPGLTPAFFREKAEFQGNGFSPASNIDHGLDERRAPAAGLNWVVPVK